MVRFRSNLVQSFTTSQTIHYKVQSPNLIGMGIVVKADKDWRGVGRTQVVMHSQLPRFLVYFFFYRSFSVSRHEKAAPQMHTRGSVIFGRPTGMLEGLNKCCCTFFLTNRWTDRQTDGQLHDGKDCIAYNAAWQKMLHSTN